MLPHLSNSAMSEETHTITDDCGSCLACNCNTDQNYSLNFIAYLNRYVFNLDLKESIVLAILHSSGSLFHRVGAAYANDRSQ